MTAFATPLAVPSDCVPHGGPLTLVECFLSVREPNIIVDMPQYLGPCFQNEVAESGELVPT
jgi:hypothetical protein